ncbi:hypothetical protein DF3PB_940006 [uncultured Defluviicoccus sp.]|uniref:Uncharacterized protein n=1 Tax=metagenome TaxID=256318 RepID=A0A380TMB7_9ZZZZ|nr:hypothetical protein DF3PB_940006 [uncultured Defluviicoccus sp.]
MITGQKSPRGASQGFGTAVATRGVLLTLVRKQEFQDDCTAPDRFLRKGGDRKIHHLPEYPRSAGRTRSENPDCRLRPQG